MFSDNNLSPAAKELLKLAGPVELLRVAPMPEVERLSGLSDDSLRRHHSDKLINLGPRRKGMRVIDALMIQQAARAAGAPRPAGPPDAATG
jgi:hypothetical protein